MLLVYFNFCFSVLVTFRGCADGWVSSGVLLDYVGCQTQSMWQRDVEWCFCDASLCNGDSIESIGHKYLYHDVYPEAYKGINTEIHIFENLKKESFKRRHIQYYSWLRM